MVAWVRSNRWRLAATVALLAVIFIWSSRVSLFRINQVVFDDKVVSASSAAPVEQTFVSNYPGLTSITLQLVEPFPPGDQPVTLRLLELSPATKEELALSGPLSTFKAGGELRFAFEPLDDTTARQYRLIIATQGASPLLLRAHHLNVYLAGELAGGGDLMFDIRYNGFLLPSVMALLPRLTQNKPGLLGQQWSYVLLGLLFLVILAGTFIRMVSRSSNL